MATGTGRFVVAGGSIAGLASSLALARAGAQVTIVERDVIPPAKDPEEAFLVERPGVPQSHFLHAFLARMVKVMRQRFPDLLDELLETGARVDRPPMAESFLDEDVCILLARRSTVEWVLRRVTLAEPNVNVIGGRRVVGVTGQDRTVDGALLDDGSTVEGSVIACTGRRGDIGSWLSPLGATIDEQLVRSELVYITRWYQAPEFDSGTGGLLRDLGYLSYLVVPADGGTLAVAVGLPPEDSELRACLLNDNGFDRVASMLPGLGKGLADAAARPLRSSQPMAGLVNRLRRFTERNGDPLVAGFHAVGDAHTCTNPAYGRGCSLAFVQATLLADAISAHPDDLLARAHDYEAASGREVEPWFHSSVMMDQARAAMRNSSNKGVSDAAGATSGGQPDLLAVLQVVAAGTVTDPVVLGGFARLLHLLVTPNELFSDPVFLQRMMELIANPPSLPAGSSGPTRDELLASASEAA
jgi:2-polyprenyl-6-methoxyphenol hydroxylase-like FAD-dependent oxidoreductase